LLSTGGAPFRLLWGPIEADGQVQLGVEAAQKQGFILEAATNWADWVAVATNRPGVRGFQFRAAPEPGKPMRFFRARLFP